MAQTPPPSLTPTPTPAPQRGDRATFSSRVDAFVTWISAAVAQFAALATNVYNNAVDAYGNAIAAATSANASQSSALAASASATTAQGIANAPAYTDASTTSLAIGTGAKVFTVPAGKSWGPGMSLAATATPGNSMTGTVTSYSGTTLTLNILGTTGSGTFSTWSIGLAQVPRGLVLLKEYIPPGGSATLNMLNDFNGLYDSYKVEGFEIGSTSSGALGMFLAVAGVADTGTVYAQTSVFSGAQSTYAAGPSITTDVVDPAGKGANFELIIKNVNSAAGIKTVEVSVIFDNTATTMKFENKAIGYRGGVVTGLRINAVVGNLKAQGVVRIYGIQKNP